MSNYLLESTDSYALKHKIKEIIQKENFGDITINSYDLEESSLEQAIEDLDTYGLFSDKKIIHVANFQLFDAEKEEKSLKHFLSYLKNPNPNNLLFISATKFDERKKQTKQLKENFTCLKVDLNSKEVIQTQLKDYQLENGVISTLLEYANGDNEKVYQDCEILKNYCFETKKINVCDVEELIQKKLGDQTEISFELVKRIAGRDKVGALKLYQELLNYQMEPIAMVALIASQIRILYQVKILSKKNLSSEEIRLALNEKSVYRINKTKEFITNYQEEQLLSLMRQLSDLDFKMKTTDASSKHLLELFILNL